LDPQNDAFYGVGKSFVIGRQPHDRLARLRDEDLSLPSQPANSAYLVPHRKSAGTAQPDVMRRLWWGAGETRAPSSELSEISTRRRAMLRPDGGHHADVSFGETHFHGGPSFAKEPDSAGLGARKLVVHVSVQLSVTHAGHTIRPELSFNDAGELTNV
jgi:hypothetical protein